MTPEDLIKFEKDIADIYESGIIKAPVHLRNNNEKQLISIFQDNNIKKEDYVFSTWASHLHALLKGIPRQEIKEKILAGKSITLHFPKHNFYSSAIVSGTCPIAVGTAWNLKKSRYTFTNNRVYCFIGDMSFLTGITSESIKYSLNHDLPITWVIEDNNKSVGTDTKETWKGSTEKWYQIYKELSATCKNFKIIYYSYETTYPHSGTGVFVEF